jgi:hypothetical protein
MIQVRSPRSPPGHDVTVRSTPYSVYLGDRHHSPGRDLPVVGTIHRNDMAVVLASDPGQLLDSRVVGPGNYVLRDLPS